jgi:hypothetical protein
MEVKRKERLKKDKQGKEEWKKRKLKEWKHDEKRYKELTQINGSTKRNKTRIKFRKEEKNNGRMKEGKLS